MMTLRMQIVVGILLLLAFVLIVHLARRKKLDPKYAMLWIGVLGVIAVLDVFPGIMDSLAHILGVGEPIHMIFFFGFCFMLVIIFFLTKSVARLSEHVRKLIQEIALLRDATRKKTDEGDE